MNSRRIAVAAFVGIVIALWWAVMPPHCAPPQGGPIAEQRRLQGPANSQLNGKQCVCAEGSRWNPKKDLSFIPLRPERVIEVRYDHMEGNRFRHTAQFVRWRPDRDPRSCTFEQLEEPVSFDLAEILGAGRSG